MLLRFIYKIASRKNRAMYMRDFITRYLKPEMAGRSERTSSGAGTGLLHYTPTAWVTADVCTIPRNKNSGCLPYEETVCGSRTAAFVIGATAWHSPPAGEWFNKNNGSHTFPCGFHLITRSNEKNKLSLSPIKELSRIKIIYVNCSLLFLNYSRLHEVLFFINKRRLGHMRYM